ncbi:MAG: hypothetical protein A2026_15310 [Deltaproteobacteria bacterium RBG_19FT_COMBO_46_12]|nr:MAG: hypothetical protein A2026_15310 [Deltaproteobacteria bacterium RBG_19FT_COMBO_46_12]
MFKQHQLLKKMYQYPELMGLMRNIFTEVMEQKGITRREELFRQALEEMKADGVPDTESNRQDYTEALIDFYFASNFTPPEIENYINLARKRDKANTLGTVVNNDQATSMQIYRALREFCDIPKGEVFISREEAEGTRVALINHFISNHLPFISIAKNYVTIRDTDSLLQRSLWSRKRTGKLGGKAAGIILAEKILLPTLEERDPELEEYIRVPATWYLNSGVFSEFLDRNNLHLLHTFKYKERETIEKESLSVEEKFRFSSFTPEVIEDFRKILEEIGEYPIIIRSSSLLEDSFGLAFSGKYQSVFLTNQGDSETRLSHFLIGVKRVFASTYSPDPILYRRDHGLLDFDERMSMMVQKVVGRNFGDFFFPLASGVMFSRNTYTWNPKIKKEEGLIRLVFGLGTRAVDRVGSDYPRMIPLSHPQLRPEITAEQIKKYSQKEIDLLNMKKGTLETVDFRTLTDVIEQPELYYAVSLQTDGHMAPPLFKTQPLKGNELCLTFENLLTKTPFVKIAKKILTKVEAAYGRPVDIEFAWDDNKLYLLQCRPLSTRTEPENVLIPENIPKEEILFTTHAGLSNSIVHDLEYIVYVDPKAYDTLETIAEKMKIASVVNHLNKLLGDKRYALMGPGRWGSNDINLGVRVTYANINKTKLLVEIAFAKEGYTPEVSYGTHFFQDLVEADIAIVPIFPDDPEGILNEPLLLNSENILNRMAPEFKNCDDVVRVIHVPSVCKNQFLQVYLDVNRQQGIGFFAPSQKE